MSLFGDQGEQSENIERVGVRIGRSVEQFWELRLKGEQVFHVDDLLHWVRTMVSEDIAPDSPGRIMRDMRKKGAINYQCIDRRDSRYRALPLGCPVVAPKPVTRPPSAATQVAQYRVLLGDIERWLRARGDELAAERIVVRLSEIEGDRESQSD